MSVACITVCVGARVWVRYACAHCVCKVRIHIHKMCDENPTYWQCVASSKLIAEGQIECSGSGAAARRQQNATRHKLTVPIGWLTECTTQRKQKRV